MGSTSATVVSLLTRMADQPETLGDGDCEVLHAGLIGQPVNTITSLGYVAGGMWLLNQVPRLARSERVASTAYALAVAFAGVGSVAYHGPQFGGAQLLHDLPVVAMVGLGAGVPLARMLRGRPGFGAPRTAGTPSAGSSSEAPSSGLTARRRITAAAAAAVVGGLCYLGGRTAASTCDPDSLVQLHGAWHLATALAATLWGSALWMRCEPSVDGADSGAGHQGMVQTGPGSEPGAGDG